MIRNNEETGSQPTEEHQMQIEQLQQNQNLEPQLTSPAGTNFASPEITGQQHVEQDLAHMEMDDYHQPTDTNLNVDNTLMLGGNIPSQPFNPFLGESQMPINTQDTQMQQTQIGGFSQFQQQQTPATQALYDPNYQQRLQRQHMIQNQRFPGLYDLNEYPQQEVSMSKESLQQIFKQMLDIIFKTPQGQQSFQIQAQYDSPQQIPDKRASSSGRGQMVQQNIVESFANSSRAPQQVSVAPRQIDLNLEDKGRNKKFRRQRGTRQQEEESKTQALQPSIGQQIPTSITPGFNLQQIDQNEILAQIQNQSPQQEIDDEQIVQSSDEEGDHSSFNLESLAQSKKEESKKMRQMGMIALAKTAGHLNILNHTFDINKPDQLEFELQVYDERKQVQRDEIIKASIQDLATYIATPEMLSAVTHAYFAKENEVANRQTILDLIQSVSLAVDPASKEVLRSGAIGATGYAEQLSDRNQRRANSRCSNLEEKEKQSCVMSFEIKEKPKEMMRKLNNPQIVDLIDQLLKKVNFNMHVSPHAMHGLESYKGKLYNDQELILCRFPGKTESNNENGALIDVIDFQRSIVVPESHKFFNNTSLKTTLDILSALMEMHNEIFSIRLYLNKQFALMAFAAGFGVSSEEIVEMLANNGSLSLQHLYGTVFDNKFQFYKFKQIGSILRSQFDNKKDSADGKNCLLSQLRNFICQNDVDKCTKTGVFVLQLTYSENKTSFYVLKIKNPESDPREFQFVISGFQKMQLLKSYLDYAKQAKTGGPKKSCHPLKVIYSEIPLMKFQQIQFYSVRKFKATNPLSEKAIRCQTVRVLFEIGEGQPTEGDEYMVELCEEISSYKQILKDNLGEVEEDPNSELQLFITQVYQKSTPAEIKEDLKKRYAFANFEAVQIKIPEWCKGFQKMALWDYENLFLDEFYLAHNKILKSKKFDFFEKMIKKHSFEFPVLLPGQELTQSKISSSVISILALEVYESFRVGIYGTYKNDYEDNQNKLDRYLKLMDRKRGRSISQPQLKELSILGDQISKQLQTLTWTNEFLLFVESYLEWMRLFTNDLLSSIQSLETPGVYSMFQAYFQNSRKTDPIYKVLEKDMIQAYSVVQLIGKHHQLKLIKGEQPISIQDLVSSPQMQEIFIKHIKKVAKAAKITIAANFTNRIFGSLTKENKDMRKITFDFQLIFNGSKGCMRLSQIYQELCEAMKHPDFIDEEKSNDDEPLMQKSKVNIKERTFVFEGPPNYCDDLPRNNMFVDAYLQSPSKDLYKQKTVFILCQDGKQVFKMDKNGKKVQLKDAKGNLVYKRDANGLISYSGGKPYIYGVPVVVFLPDNEQDKANYLAAHPGYTLKKPSENQMNKIRHLIDEHMDIASEDAQTEDSNKTKSETLEEAGSNNATL